MKEINEGDLYTNVKEGVSLVKMGAEWCGPCKSIQASLSNLKNEIKGIKMYVVDIDKNPRLATSLDVRSIPTLIIYKNGEEVSRKTGSIPKAELKSWIEDFK